jgi:hypothetical protein
MSELDIASRETGDTVWIWLMQLWSASFVEDASTRESHELGAMASSTSGPEGPSWVSCCREDVVQES